jgi:benzaldehyde dehydrogenase (NAD)
VRAGGTHDRLFYRPTVLADVTPGMPAFREEIFGPVAPVVVVKDVDEAVAAANDQTLNNDAYAPFGGTGASGNGSRFGSQSSWDEFTRWQWVTARPQAHGFPF